LKKYKCQDKVVEVTGEKLTRRKTLKTFVWISSTNSASVQVPTWCPHQRHTAVIMEHNERCTATDVGKQNALARAKANTFDTTKTRSGHLET
jgi:hypothetical protein